MNQALGANAGEARVARYTGPLSISVFREAPVIGTTASVYIGSQPMTEANMAALARQNTARATCFAWPEGEYCHSVHCFSAYGRIDCCGHGLLATGRILLDSTGASTLHLKMGRRNWIEEQQSDNWLAVWEEGENLWLLFSRVICEPIPVPEWAADAFSVAPVAAAKAGGESGYLVLEWGANAPINELMVYSDVIASNTSRAVIATARADHSGAFDYLLRYFAPQYGTAEDAVTGSAHRVACDYWARRTDQLHLRALQCSPEGGVVYTRLTNAGVAIGGRVSYIQ